jgi:transcriptional regulator with XRE-family HTH domain
MPTLRETLRKKRLTAGMTLAQVAQFLGVSEATASRYESGKIHNLKRETLYRLAALYKVTLEELVHGEASFQISEELGPKLPRELESKLPPEPASMEIRLLTIFRSLKPEAREALIAHLESLRDSTEPDTQEV